ncbi:hypothetical protein [Komagataeibacter xylinus]|uniref:TonB C-terminal domain-containing protein n=1 Tax=Komagataeibacter xylinus TaxID=28448 RepID=A0A857FLR6_KOMXY|nr:hypothetical protein [Komagataeibacter xylinus]QHC35218.1 hypothetical protein FMA36_06630 [Komagataeibacter xylinus]
MHVPLLRFCQLVTALPLLVALGYGGNGAQAHRKPPAPPIVPEYGRQDTRGLRSTFVRVQYLAVRAAFYEQLLPNGPFSAMDEKWHMIDQEMAWLDAHRLPAPQADVSARERLILTSAISQVQHGLYRDAITTLNDELAHFAPSLPAVQTLLAAYDGLNTPASLEQATTLAWTQLRSDPRNPGYWLTLRDQLMRFHGPNCDRLAFGASVLAVYYASPETRRLVMRPAVELAHPAQARIIAALYDNLPTAPAPGALPVPATEPLQMGLLFESMGPELLDMPADTAKKMKKGTTAHVTVTLDIDSEGRPHNVRMAELTGDRLLAQVAVENLKQMIFPLVGANPDPAYHVNHVLQLNLEIGDS